MGELILWIVEFLSHLVVFPKYDEEEHLERMRVAEHCGHMVRIFSGFLVLFIQIWMFGPVSPRILMVNDVVVFMQYVDGSVKDRDRANVFVLRVIGTKERMPAPIDAGKQQHILAHGEENKPEGERRTQEAHEARERNKVQRPCDHFHSDLEVSFVIELDSSGDVGSIAEPSRQVAQEITEIIPRFVRRRYHIMRAVVVFVVVDAVPVRKGRGKDPVEQANPPIENVIQKLVLRSPKAEACMSLFVAERVHVSEVHEVWANTGSTEGEKIHV